jgi:hypothetical protein
LLPNVREREERRGLRPLAKVARPAGGTLAPVNGAGRFRLRLVCERILQSLVGNSQVTLAVATAAAAAAVLAAGRLCNNCRRGRDQLIVETKTGAPIETGIKDAAGAELRQRAGQIDQRAELELTVGTREALGTGALVSAWAGVLAGAVVQARIMRAAIIKILIAKDAAPVLMAHTLPGRQAEAILAARIRDAFVATGPSPSGPTETHAGPVAVAVLLVAAGLATGHVAVLAQPTVRADLLAGGRALVVAELVVAGPTEAHAAVAVVLGRARDPVGGMRYGRRRVVLVGCAF